MLSQYFHVDLWIGSTCDDKIDGNKPLHSEINMLKALADKEHGQLSAVVIAEHVYDYLLRSRPELVGELVKSNRPIDTALYQFQFPKTDNGRINMLYTNRLLDKLRRNGELEKIVNNYTQ